MRQPPPYPEGRLGAQLRFLLEIDALKTVLRRSLLADGSRRENSAEHSWHLAMLAIVLAEHAAEPVDLAKVIRMVLVHDIVEIDAGDTYIYDTEGYLTKDDRERTAADRIFALLPADQAVELRGLWEEYEAHETAEARFAAVCDRLAPLLHNYVNAGEVWRANGITDDRVRERNGVIADGSTALWEYASALIDDAVARGFLLNGS
jgi:putative hydrolases of HD superfamily